MDSFYLGLLSGIWLYMLLDTFIINFIYLRNCDLFLDIMLFRSKRDKLIKTCVDRFNEEVI